MAVSGRPARLLPEMRPKGSDMVTNIDRSTLLALIDQGAVILDVLPEREYGAGHIPGALNMPLRKLDADAVADLHRDKPVVVY